MTSSRTPTPPTCAICLEPIPHSRRARLLPCNHEYDLDCAVSLLTNLTRSNQICPLCRTPVFQVDFAFDPSGSHSSHILNAPSDSSGPFLREDERITPEMNEEERRRIVELRRLRHLDNYDPSIWQLVWLGAWSREGERTDLVARMLHIKVYQRVEEGKVITVCILKRNLQMKSVIGHEPTFSGPSNAGEIAKAKEDVEKVIRCLGIRTPFEDLEMGGPEWRVGCDERGIQVSSMKSIEITKKTNSITMNDITTLSEKYPADRPGPIQDTEELRKAKREVKLARQEMQGVLEIIRSHGEFHDFKELERVCTGILEPIAEEDWECEYCEVKHRNGDCRLPWGMDDDDEYVVGGPESDLD